MSKRRKHLIVVVADVHGGSSIAICQPEGFQLDDGGWYLPSKAQRWIWNYYVKAIGEAKKLAKEEGAEVTLAVNGDMTDGLHHLHTNAQYTSALDSHHVRTASRVLVHAIEELRPVAVHMTRGTGAHVGKGASLEEGLARVLREKGYPMIEDPDTGQVTSYRRRYEVGGLLIDQTHHGRMGQRNHTRNPYLIYYAQDIEFEARDDGDRPPDIAIRSHNHIYGESGRPYKRITRLIATPCLQLATEHTHRLAVERMADIGIVMTLIRDGRDEVIPLIAKPKRPTIIRSAA